MKERNTISSDLKRITNQDQVDIITDILARISTQRDLSTKKNPRTSREPTANRNVK